MKILEVTNHFWPCIGGIETHVAGICKELKKNGLKPSVLCLNKCNNSNKRLKKNEKKDNIEINRIKFIDLKYYKPAFNALSFFKKNDLIHVHGINFFSDYAIFTKFIHKKPVIVSTHGGIFHTKKIKLIKWIYFNLFQKIILNFADKIIAVSKNDYKLFSKIVPKNKLVLIENGVDLKKFKKTKNKKINKKIIFVGRISKNKRIDLLIKAFAKASEKNKKLELTIIGKEFDAGLKKELINLTKKLRVEKKILFKENLSHEELVKELNKYSFFASASEFEGFGLSLIEAMNIGLIPIVSKIETFKEFIKNNKNGYLINYNNTIKASELINKITSKPLKELKKISENTEKKAKEYDWNKQIKKYLKEYEGVTK